MGCLPSYNPEYQARTRMSQSARDLAAALKKLGGVYDLNTKNNESGRENSTQGAPESGGIGTGGALTVVEEVAEFEVSLKKRKKQDMVISKFGNMNVDAIVERSPGASGSGKDGFNPVANIDRNFAGFLSELPTEAEWSEMGRQGATTVMDEVVGVQLGVRIAGAANLVRKELKELEALRNSSALIREKDDAIQKIQDKFNSLRTSVGSRIEGMKESLKVAEESRKTVEARAGELTEELVGVRAELQSRKSEKKIIDEFRKSSKYSEELADAAAAKIQRCWVVAERHKKTDPRDNFDTFSDLYVAAEETVANGGGEPEPYTGSASAVPDDDDA
ncbi:hypothetical protein POM88_040923 [Heracleum sosnowskyi]|uniref:Uncharacterized protein n=1 Tax=Heracleum sosnowskyi TaxID=360622 RepID=A0AAD8HD68_9APIA|nr:hypothetical protein POM88_040923 [Heracleum sosnowskyi]